MSEHDVIPIGARLGSERLYGEEPEWQGERFGPIVPGSGPPLDIGEELDPRTWKPYTAEQMTPDPERRDIPPGDAPERKDLPRPKHGDPRPKRGKPPHREGGKSRLALQWPTVQWRNLGSNSLEIAGIGSITAGSYQIAAWLGLIVLGVCLIILGIATGGQRAE